MKRYFLKSRMKPFPIFLLNFNQDILGWRVLLNAHSYTFGLHLQNSLPGRMPKNLPEKVITINQNISRANCRNQVLWKILAKVLCMSDKSEKMMSCLFLCPVPQENQFDKNTHILFRIGKILTLYE